MKCIDLFELQKSLNPAQFAAAAHTHGASLILAGAGSGKTRVLTYKIAHILSEYPVRSSEIMAVTFTNKAAGELKKRLNTLLIEHEGEYLRMPWVGTFHSICVRLLRQHLATPPLNATSGIYSNFSIFDDDDQKKVLKEVLKKFGHKEDAPTLKKLKGRISGWKNAFVFPDEAYAKAFSFEEREYAEMYEDYQKRLAANNAMDFDDLLGEAVKMLHKNPEILHHIQTQIQYLFVDEYQDTNQTQYQLLRLLTKGLEVQNITVVGDDDQSIYGWRGADLEIMRRFERDFKGKIFKLEQNYRSTSMIVQAAGSVIKNNPRQKSFEKQVFSTRNEGDKVQVIAVSDERQEATHIATSIRRQHQNRYDEFAILYRTNAQSRALEDALRKDGIPHQIIGGMSFYQRKEIKDILAYLKVLANPFDEISLQRIINVPRRGIGDSTLEKIASFAGSHQIPFYGACQQSPQYLSAAISKKIIDFVKLIEGLKADLDHSPLSIVVENLLEKSGYQEELHKENSDESVDRLQNLSEFLSMVVEAEEENPDLTLTHFLQDRMLDTSTTDNADQADADNVRLMTLHAAKGLEFKSVFLAGCDEGLLPMVQSNGEKDFEEERRLFYVGATRAMDKLAIYTAQFRKMYGTDKFFTTSRFVKEMDKDVIQHVNLSGRQSSLDSPFYTGSDAFSNSTPRIQGGLRATSAAEASVYKKPTPAKVMPSYEDESQLDEQYLRVGAIVMHTKFGRGRVIHATGNSPSDRVRVDFNQWGEKTLVLEFANLRIVG